MTNSTNGISIDIRVNGEKLDCVNRFKYLGAIIADEGSKPAILARIAQTTAAVQRPHIQRRGAKQNLATHWAPRRPLNHSKATQTEMVWARNKIYKACQDNPAGHSALGGRRRGRQKKRWEDNIPEWTGHDAGHHHEEGSEEWRELVARSSVAPQRSTRLRDRWRWSSALLWCWVQLWYCDV